METIPPLHYNQNSKKLTQTNKHEKRNEPTWGTKGNTLHELLFHRSILVGERSWDLTQAGEDEKHNEPTRETEG